MCHIGAVMTEIAENCLNLPGRPQDHRVVVAMSGGVDSSVVAALLHEQGYQVIGITLQLYDQGEIMQRKGACCAGQDIYDARQVADRLNIPHYVLDYESRFKQAVVDQFADSYLRGETPIPCVTCNQTVKFNDLLATARELGASAMATGHYVRRIQGANGAEMHRAVDPKKDQSYFLFTTTQEQLNFCHFPLGGLEKSQTRALAARFGLKVADKPDSQDICFVPNGDYAGIVQKLRPEASEPGQIIDRDGKVLGQHEGIIHFTVGQRKGLGIAAAEPLYVLRLEPETRSVVVGPQSALLENSLNLRALNWLGSEIPEDGIEVVAKIRSAHAGAKAQLFRVDDQSARLVFAQPQAGIAPGQAGVLYQGDRLLGGGWIERPKAPSAVVKAA